MDKNEILVVVGVYGNRSDATADLEALNKAVKEADLGELAAAVVTKEADGKLDVHQVTNEGKEAAAAGLVVGALPPLILAAVFPPIGLAMVGAGALMGISFGGLLGALGHLQGGFSRRSLAAATASLEEGQSSLLAVLEASHKDTYVECLTGADQVRFFEVSAEDAASALDAAAKQN